jgi:multiple sugar transport system ATP-binding protein
MEMAGQRRWGVREKIMASISLEGIRKVYPNGFEAVQSLNLHIEEGELLVVVGPSGCGKTTVLRMIAGLEQITSGDIRIGSKVVNDTSPRDRDIAMVFQSYALYPQMNVAQNIGFPLRMKKLPKAEVAKRVKEAAGVLGITDWLDRKPSQLSGGQRQRVAMGRAIVRAPSAFLMDEPLSNLDAKLRVQMRAEVARVQKRIGVATLYVTHDQTEAMTLGHRVAVLRSGVLQQCDTPQVLYNSPTNMFVAGFLGSPAMNLLEATLSSDSTRLQLGSQSINVPAGLQEKRPGLRRFANAPVVVGIRPEDLSIGSDTDERETIQGDIELVESLGAELLIHFRTDAVIVQGEAMAGDKQRTEAHDEEEEVVAQCIARIEPHHTVRIGDRVNFSLNTARLEFFDPSTGNAIWT